MLHQGKVQVKLKRGKKSSERRVFLFRHEMRFCEDLRTANFRKSDDVLPLSLVT